MVGATGLEPANLSLPKRALYQAELRPGTGGHFAISRTILCHAAPTVRDRSLSKAATHNSRRTLRDRLETHLRRVTKPLRSANRRATPRVRFADSNPAPT